MNPDSLEPVVTRGLALLDRRGAEYAAEAKAANTRRAYRSDWKAFCQWCADHGLDPLPAEPTTIQRHVTQMADRGAKVSSIERRVACLAYLHRRAGHNPPPTRDPYLAEIMAGIRRRLGTAVAKKSPLETEDIRRLIAATPVQDEDGDLLLAGVRDRALLLVDFACGTRSVEIGSFDLGDLELTKDGYRVRLARSKTDQEGQGQWKAIPYGSHPDTCPVRALQTWLTAAGITDGPLFRSVDRHGRMGSRHLSAEAVRMLVKRACIRAGLDPRRYGGHSVRSGHVTSAAQRGAQTHEIKRQTGHRSMSVLEGYIRPATIFLENSATKLGL